MKGRPIRSEDWDKRMSIETLTRRHEAVCDEFYTFARQASEEDRLDDTFVDHFHDPPARKTFGGCILHLTTRAMHHRAQLLFMLRQLGVADVPEGDALGWERQHRGGWSPA